MSAKSAGFFQVMYDDLEAKKSLEIALYSLRLSLTCEKDRGYTVANAARRRETIEDVHSNDENQERQQEQEEDYLTLEQAYKYLKVSRATIFNYVNRGLIHRYKRTVPRGVFYKKSELDKLKEIEPET